MRIESMRVPILAFVAVAVPLTAAADEVFLKSGGRVSGRVVTQTATEVEVDVGAGRIGIPASSVLRIEKGHSALQEYEDRAGRVPSGDVEGWLTLGEWASAQGLSAQAREAYHRALGASPSDARANAALGNVQIDGRWVSEDEGYRARGYVRYQGEWITPAEHEAMLRERAAEDAQERARVQAQTNAREAEARAQEAEARAREAEAKAAEEANGLPLWYGWGAGPVAWPTGPIVTQPIARPLTVPR
jgi:hypothetical protein